MPAVCIKCKMSITPTVTELKCVVCNTFSHIKCTEITRAQSDVIKSTERIEWKCSDCRNINFSKGPNSTCHCCTTVKRNNRGYGEINGVAEGSILSEAKKLTDVNFEEIIQEVNDRQNPKANLIIYRLIEQSARSP